MHRPYGWPTIIGLGLVVVAFMALSLCVTATGTARFAVSMGYDAGVGYAVGAIFDVAKGMLLMGVVALWARGALGVFAAFAIVWICLVTFSWLATHSTVSTAIASIERTGTWKMEVRGNARAELTSVEQQLAALSRPTPPRPAKTVQEALAAERVPPSIWQDSQECGRIQESVHFARACAQVVQLRRELAAARDYERLSSRATELRKGLAEAPIVATADPLPAAFSATLGRVLPIGGTEGVALLVTVVVELMSCCGLAGVAVLYNSRKQREGGRPAIGSLTGAGREVREAEREPPCQPRLPTLPKPSLSADKPSLKGLASGAGRGRRFGKGDTSNAPSNILTMRPRSPSSGLPGEGGPATPTTLPSHVSDFVEQRLTRAAGMSLGARELRGVYEAWCKLLGYQPLSTPKFAAELKRLGFDKWKSGGLIRYRDLQLAA
jgi:hypothetical protein